MFLGTKKNVFPQTKFGPTSLTLAIPMTESEVKPKTNEQLKIKGYVDTTATAAKGGLMTKGETKNTLPKTHRHKL